MGFVGPKDIFRNPEAIFRQFEPTKGDESPFDIMLGMEGDNFSVNGMHFKLGLYEHQSAGAIEGVLRLILEQKFLKHGDFDQIENINIVAYEPAFGIIGDPAKKNPTTRQSADHSMCFIISTLLRKAIEDKDLYSSVGDDLNSIWKRLFLAPADYGMEGLNNSHTRKLMEKVTFTHGGKEYDEKYPDGIPTSVVITTKDGQKFDSGFVMYPSGHARNDSCDLRGILDNKFQALGRLGLEQNELDGFISKLNNLENLSNKDLQSLYYCNIKYANKSIDA